MGLIKLVKKGAKVLGTGGPLGKVAGALTGGGKGKQSVMATAKAAAGKKSGLTPLGREVNDSAKANGLMSAARTLGRGYAKEVDASFNGAPGRAIKAAGKKVGALTKEPQPVAPKPSASAAPDATRTTLRLKKKVVQPLPTPAIPALPAAANTIARRNKNKLKDMSRRITRGTSAANSNPFKR